MPQAVRRKARAAVAATRDDPAPARNTGLAARVAALESELQEAREQQAATAEILQVINASPGDLAPVFAAMLEKASRLCEAETAHLLRYEAPYFTRAASLGVSEDFDEILPLNTPVPHIITRDSIPYRMLASRAVVHVPDAREDESVRAGAPAETAAAASGIRTALFVPLLREGEVVGGFVMHRMEVRPFTDKQIALLENFAAQAAIAMENARLLTETREALERQTATAEVLQVINSSPGDLAPVFDVMLEKALNLCEANLGLLYRFDGDAIHPLAVRGASAAAAEMLKQSVAIEPESAIGRLARSEEAVIHNPDITDDEIYRAGVPSRRKLVEVTGARTALWVALRKDHQLVGVFIIYRQEVRPFTDKEIALLENFAAQAVIAMDNARLLDEIRRRQAELRVTFDNMGDGVAMFDADMRLAAWNRNFQKILDLPDEFVAGRPTLSEYFDFMAARGEYGSSELEGELRRTIQIADHESRFERARPDGRVIEVRRNAVPGGGSVLIFSDVTERKRAEAEIRAARDAAEAALRELKTAQASLIQAEKMASLGQLTAGIAHEIKNPLNFVNNFAGLSVELLGELKEAVAPGLAMLDDDRRADVDETIEMLTSNLDKIGEHGKRADNIVKSMLEHSRGGSGERRSVDLNSLIEEALNLAYHGARAQDQSFNITLERDLAEALAPVELVPQDMTRVLLNLFGNGFYAANKRRASAADAGFKPTLTVTTRDFGTAVEVAVRDNGTGIGPEVIGKLFQPFFTTKPTGEGTGLGLSISYDIVTHQHGGTIFVDSELGKFTEFTIRLPRGASE
ncbi:MAG TPA: PAS-domain containing protein [Stellaceae bacterium]|nr:PAS-domain containing protein [Stellaceae bacterium]